MALFNGQRAGGLPGGARVISGSGDPTFVTSAEPGSHYTDTATSDLYVHVGSSANDYDWMNVTQGGIRNPLTLLGSTDLRRWVDTIYGEGISYRTDVGIDRLYDLTGNGYHYEQDTDADQPPLDATGGFGSTPEIDTGGNTNNADNLLSTAAAVSSGERPTWLIGAACGNDAGGGWAMRAYYSGGRVAAVSNKDAASYNPYAHGTQMTQTSPTLDANHHVFRHSYSAGTNVLKMDGVSVTLSSSPAGFTNGTALPGDLTSSSIGNAGGTVSNGGYMFELLVGRDLTVDELVEIGKFYNWKRGLAVTKFVQIK